MASQDAQSYYELRNPFDEWTEDDMKKATTEFAQHPESGLEDYVHYFVRGGMLNLDPQAYDNESAMKVSPEERKALDRETRPQSKFDRFRQTKGLYFLVALCSAAAAGKSPKTMLTRIRRCQRQYCTRCNDLSSVGR